ncbi:MAG: hypothetical protein VYA85_09915 [Verrucomicrobiota bacterium]|nr:hypothetical protein [Verrucomicrobiota bacterium]
MPYRYGIIITFLFFSLLPKARANEVTVVFKNDLNYKGTDDTFIKRGAGFSGGMSNFGACKMMQVNEETRIGLMRFDVSSLFKKYKKIVSIKLRLFSKNAPKQGSIQVHRLNIANSAWREGGNCGGTVIGGNRNEVTWMHLVDYGGFPSPPPSWASRTAGPTSPGVDFDEKALGSKKNSESKINEAFEIEFSGDLSALIDDWSLASPIKELKDKGGNPCWTVDWNWSQPAAETANEGILLRGSEGSIHEFHTSESENLSLRPQLIIKYLPRLK